MSEVDDFLGQMMPRQVEAEAAMHNGDAGPRLAMWSHRDPVTLFGAWLSKSGWEEVSRTFPWLASRMADCSAYDVELVASPAMVARTPATGFAAQAAQLNDVSTGWGASARPSGSRSPRSSKAMTPLQSKLQPCS